MTVSQFYIVQASDLSKKRQLYHYITIIIYTNEHNKQKLWEDSDISVPYTPNSGGPVPRSREIDATALGMVWYGILEFNIPLDTV